MTKHGDAESILATAKQVLQAEGQAVLEAGAALNASFCDLVRTIQALRGRVVMTGVGKSGIIANKIAATLASTGTPAFFLNPVDAVHGDLGMVSPDDLLMTISNSGETQELLNVVYAAQKLGPAIGVITSDPDSSLARASTIVLCVRVKEEACPLGLAPTTSTTVVLAVGDALALTLLALRDFTSRDYARFHPGGSLGRRLSLLVRDFMRTGDRLPLVAETDSLTEALSVMTEKEVIGVALVCNDDGLLTGILTDGDLRRILLAHDDPADLMAAPVRAFMSHRPKTIDPDEKASEAIRLMEVRGITSLAIIDAQGRPQGIVHLHDILGRSKFLV